MAEHSDDEYPAQYRNSGRSAKPSSDQLNRDKPPRNFNGPAPNSGEQEQRNNEMLNNKRVHQPNYDQSQDRHQRNSNGPGQNGGGPVQPNYDQQPKDRPQRNFNGPGPNGGEQEQRNNDMSNNKRPPSSYQQPQYQRESQYQHLAPGGRPPQGYDDYRTSATPYDNPVRPNRESQHVYSVMGGPSTDMQQNNGRQGNPNPQGYRGQGVPPPNYKTSQVYDNPGLETEHRQAYQPNMQQPPKNQQEPQFSDIQDIEQNPEDELKPRRSQPTESQQQTPRTKSTMILGKDMTVMKLYTASLAAWLSLVTLIISAFFYIIAFASAGWAVVDTVDSPGYNRRLGLWQSCHTQFGCTYLGISRVSDSFRAAQAFATMSLVTLMGGCAITVLYIAWQRVTFEDRSKLGKIAVGCRGLTVFLLFLTITIFGDRYRDGRYDTPAYSGRLSWAYGFATLVFFIEIGGCVLMALETFFINKVPPRTQLE